MNKCKKCGHEFEGKFCSFCGTEDTMVTCLACGNAFYGNFCNKCGKGISPSATNVNPCVDISVRSKIQGRLKTISTTSHSILLKKMFSFDSRDELTEIMIDDVGGLIYSPYIFSLIPSEEKFGYITFLPKAESSAFKNNSDEKKDRYSILFGIFQNKIFKSLANDLSSELGIELEDLSSSLTSTSRNDRKNERKRELDEQGVAYCPKCLSTSLSGSKKGFGIGKAIVGGAMTGGIGLVAGNIGAKKVRVTCLKCGHQFWAGKQ